MALGWLFIFRTPSPVVHASEAAYLLHAVSTHAFQGPPNGQFQGKPNQTDFRALQPGDIILCHNANGAYGYWTHAVLYVGHGVAVDSNDFAVGTKQYPVGHYHGYDEVAIVRPTVSRSLRSAAAQQACKELGSAYDPFAPVESANSEYCSKLIWKSYASVGVQLCPKRPWILPDDIAASQNVRWIVPGQRGYRH